MSVQRYNRIKIMNRFKLGFQQMSIYPIINLIWIIPVLIATISVILTNELAALLKKYPIISSISRGILIILTVLLFVASIISIIFIVGTISARRDETSIALVLSRNNSIGNYPPFLISKKRIMKTKIIEREFYSIIPLKEWINNEDAICDLLDIHVIGDIHYGGKNNDTGYIISFRSSKGRFASERGVIEDEEF